MNWQQQQLLANQRRIREFQAQQNVINSHGGQYISPRAGSSGYVPATMYHPSQQSYVYPPTTQWTVMDQASPQMASHYAPGYGQQYYSPHYYQRQMPNTAVPPPPPPPTMPRPNAHSAPWHSSQVVSAPPLSKPSGKGLTYAELLSKALPATTTSPQQQMSAEHRPMHDNQTQASLRASPVPKPPTIELPKPPPPPSAKPESDAYPPSLLKYVERAFLQCKSDAEKSEIQKLLKLRIQSAKQNGVLWTQDWENMALPHVPSPIGAKRKSESKLSKKQQKKLKKQQALMAAAAGAITPVGIKGVSSTTDSKLMTLPVNDVAVKLRSARFGTSLLNDVSSSISSRPLTLFHNRLRNENGDGDIELDWEALKISGTCDQLEKKYLRLTSAPDPSTVRPLQILRKSFDHILKKWLDDRNYLFFWEQMKSLRQDLTIQHIIDPFVIQVYETNARVCLEVDDLSEYNQCQTQLSELYDNHNIKDSCKSNMDEFLGYRLLYLLLTNDPMSVSLMLHDTTPTERQQDALSHAIATLRAFRTNDFCRFFELASSAPLQSFQIIRHLYPTVRHNALLRITAAFRPTLPVAALSNMLGFGDQDSCRTWLLASGVVLDQSRDNIVCKESNIVRAQLSANDSQEIVGVTHGTF